MKKFTPFEFRFIFFTLTILFVVSGYNFAISIRRGRDNVRKNDIAGIQGALDTYFQKYKVYPAATEDGRIVGCFESGPVIDEKTEIPINAIPCVWGESKFENLRSIPQDPNYKKGAKYFYTSTSQHYELYISLEGKDEAEYTKAIFDKHLQCGNEICNYSKKN